MRFSVPQQPEEKTKLPLLSETLELVFSVLPELPPSLLLLAGPPVTDPVPAVPVKRIVEEAKNESRLKNVSCWVAWRRSQPGIQLLGFPFFLRVLTCENV